MKKKYAFVKHLIAGLAIFWVDLFAGGGGTTTGIHLSKTNSIVVACVNHDPIAIASHAENHPECIHFTEDVRDFAVIEKIRVLVSELRDQYPGCVINIWASLECTNYSKAKGGLPRDADSRTLANHLIYYVDALQPDYLYIENVREFMAWGPLDENGKPISRKNGIDYIKWYQEIEARGYDYDWRLLNSADYGAYQSRERYFGQFSKKGMPISWPEATHSKVGSGNDLFSTGMKRWEAVKEILDFQNQGKSIFGRKKELAPKTHERIYAGCIKHIANGDESFLVKYYGTGSNAASINSPCDTVTTNDRFATVQTVPFLMNYYSGNDASRCTSVDNPANTLRTANGQALIQPNPFIMKYFSGRPEGKCISTEGPAGTVRCADGQSLVQCFFVNNYSNGGVTSSIDQPSPSVTSVPKQNICGVHFIDQQFGASLPQSVNEPINTITANPKYNVCAATFIDQQYGNSKPKSIEEPLNAITVKDKYSLVSGIILNQNTSTGPAWSCEQPAPTITQRTHYLLNPQYMSKGSSVDSPCFTLIARMDKMPPYLVTTETGQIGIAVFDTDSEIVVKIKMFMAAYGIADIKMRMLTIRELKLIQGFPENYVLKGTQTHQKKQIGNAVHTKVATAIARSNFEAVLNLKTISNAS